MFRYCSTTKHLEDRIPQTRHDTIVYEMSFRYGRADIVVFHLDGSASVIEVKDGTKGYTHVVAGIGQASLYAAQLSMARSGLKKVRRCLLWTSTGNVVLDSIIETACEMSGTVAMPWGRLEDHMRHEREVCAAFED